MHGCFGCVRWGDEMKRSILPLSWFPRSNLTSFLAKGTPKFNVERSAWSEYRWQLMEEAAQEAVRVCTFVSYHTTALVLSSPLPRLSESNTFQSWCTLPFLSMQWQLLTIMALHELILMAVTGSRSKCRPCQRKQWAAAKKDGRLCGG